MEPFQIFLIAACTGGAALAVATWLARQRMTGRLAKSRADGKRRLSRQEEGRKTHVSIPEHGSGAAHLPVHPRHSEAVLSLCSAVGDWHDAFRALTTPNPRLEKDPAEAICRCLEWARKLRVLSDRLAEELRGGAELFGHATYERIATDGMELCGITGRFYAATFDSVGADLATANDPRELAKTLQRERARLRRTCTGKVNEFRRLLAYEYQALRRAETRALRPERVRSGRKKRGQRRAAGGQDASSTASHGGGKAGAGATQWRTGGKILSFRSPRPGLLPKGDGAIARR